MARPRASSITASNGDDWIPREFALIRQEMREGFAGRSAESTAIGAGGIQSNDFDGTGPGDLGTTGWKIGRVIGDRSFIALNGVDVYADLAAKTASLAALVDALIEPAQFSAVDTVWTTTAGTYKTVATATLTVPAGFTKALVSANGYVLVQHTGAGDALVATRCAINGAAGDESQLIMAAGQVLSTISAATSLVTGLTSGGTFTATVAIKTPAAWSSSSFNYAHISGTVLWLR